MNKARATRLQAAQRLGRHTRAEWEAIVADANGRCVRCSAEGVKLTKDHVIPIYQGGSDAADNLRAVCRSCNSARGSVARSDTLADEIRRVRDMRAESVEAFAAHFAVSRRTVEDWEQGRRRPCGLALRQLTLLRQYHNRGRGRAAYRRRTAARKAARARWGKRGK